MNVLRHRIDAEAARAAALLAGGLVFLQTTGTLLLWLVNGAGPFEERRWPGGLIAVAAGLATGLIVLVLVWALARRSAALLVVVAVLLGATMWVLLPSRIDVSESFLPRANARWSCTGWSFHTYPVGVMDASGSTYCIGLERQISDG